MRIVIDDTARVWVTSSTALRQHFWVEGSDDQVEDQLVRLVGCIVVRFHTKVVQVRLNPHIVSGAALAELYYRLADQRPQRIALFGSDTKVCQVYTNFNIAVREIQRLVEARSTDERLVCQSVDLDIDLIDRASSFGLLLQRVHETSYVFSQEDLQAVLSGPLSGRWLAVEPFGTGCDMRVITCGTGYGIPSAEFCRQLPGSLLSSLPDKDYAKWVANSYDRASAVSRPLFQSARSVASWNNGERVLAEYARLVIPARQPNGRPVLLSTSRRSSLRRLDGSMVA